MQTAILLFLSLGFIGGQVAALSLWGMRLSLLDISVALFVLYSMSISKGQKENRDYFHRAFLPLFLTFFISTLLTPQLSSLGYVLRFTIYALVFFVSLDNKNIQKKLPITLWLSGVSVAMLGIVQYFIYPNLRNLSYLGWDPHQFRIFSTQLDPNFAGIIFVLTLILGLTFWINNKKHRGAIVAAQIITFIAFLLTYSRGSYVAFVAACIVACIYLQKIRWAILGIIFFALLLFLLPRPGGEGVNLLRSISIGSRIEDTQEALEVFAKSPIIGAGFSQRFHNSYAYLLASAGIVGAVAYIWLWYTLISKTRKNWLITVTLTAIFVHSIFDNSLFYPWVMVWMWAVVGTQMKPE